MPGIKYLVPALALASGVFAQCSTKGTMTITNAAQASQLASCDTFQGSIEVNKKASGDLALDGPREITGDLTAINAMNLESFSSSSLQTVGGLMNLTSLTNLSSLSFPQLSRVDNLFLQSIGPGVTAPDFSSGITMIKDLSIINCPFQSLDGLLPSEADSVTIVNNIYISDLMLPLTNVKGEIAVRGNTQDFSLRMPKLKMAGSLQLDNCSSIMLPSLQNASEGLSITGNTLKIFSVPKLKNVGAFAVFQNDNMSKLSAPVLETVGGAFTITDNPKLTGALSFPKVSHIAGGPNITGSFSSLSMPALTQVRGLMTIKSSKNIQSTCNRFQGVTGISKVNCIPGHPQSSSGGGNSNSNSQSSSGSSGGSGGSGGGNGAAGHHGASLGLILTAFAGVTAFFAVLC